MFRASAIDDPSLNPGAGQSAFYARPFTVPLPLIERASGVYFWDDEGRRYIDVSSGPVVSNIGHGNSCVAERIARQAKKMEYAFSRLSRNQPNIEYAARLAGLAGPGFERVHLTSGGSEAMENAIKFLRQYAIATGKPSKTKIITCEPSYHGATIATLAMNGEVLIKPFLDGFVEPSAKVPVPLSYRVPSGYTAAQYASYCADSLNQKIGALGGENVLAFVIEPIGGLSTGCVVLPDAYVSSVRDICNRHGVHLVFDEILCGMGRTGTFLAAHRWPDTLPDIVTMAKGLAAGYSPLGAVLAPASLVDELADLSGFEFQYSYNANPVSCAAGLAVLDEYDDRDLVRRARALGRELRRGLERLKQDIPIIGDIRGLGMLLAVEIVADRETKRSFPNELQVADRVRVHGLNHGLMIYSRQTSDGIYGHWFLVSPPLTISSEEIDEMLQRLEAALGDLQSELLGS